MYNRFRSAARNQTKAVNVCSAVSEQVEYLIRIIFFLLSSAHLCTRDTRISIRREVNNGRQLSRTREEKSQRWLPVIKKKGREGGEEEEEKERKKTRRVRQDDSETANDKRSRSF